MWLRGAKFVLLGLSIIFGLFLFYLIVTRININASAIESSGEILSAADAGMEQFSFYQSHNGKVQWQIIATRAQVNDAQHQAVLEDVEITLFGNEGKELHVKGDDGTLDTRSRNFLIANRNHPLIIELEGGYRVFTNHLAWIDQKKELTTNHPVKIVGNGMEVTGVGLIGKMDVEEFQVQHDVEVIFLQ